MRTKILYMLCFFAIVSVFKNTNAMEPSTMEIDFHNEPRAFDFHNMLSFYEPNYFLAFYHTRSPDYEMYENRIPRNAHLMQNEVKVQFSASVLLLRSMFGDDNLRLYFGYSQLLMWQLYTSSPFIREVNYEPLFYLKYHFAENMFANLVVDHQSNGKGGYTEVGWNRIIGSVELTAKNFYSQISIWYPFLCIRPRLRSDENLPYYLGYGKIVLSYSFKDIVLSVEGQNIESGFKRGHIMASISYSAASRVKLYLQYFTGYGQSLIEFSNRTTSFGVGVALSDWQ